MRPVDFDLVVGRDGDDQAVVAGVEHREDPLVLNLLGVRQADAGDQHQRTDRACSRCAMGPLGLACAHG